MDVGVEFDLGAAIWACRDAGFLDLLLRQSLRQGRFEIQFAQEGLAPAETCEMFRFRDGKVCEIKPYYYNPAAFDAAVAAKKAGNA